MQKPPLNGLNSVEIVTPSYDLKKEGAEVAHLFFILPPNPEQCHDNTGTCYEEAANHEQDWHQMPFVL